MFSLSFWASALLTVLNCWSWVDSQDVSVEQPSRQVTATIGGSAILQCRSKTNLIAGPVRWYKGTEPNRELIYSDKESCPRVQRVENTNRVFDIRIINITSQDEGVYYCIKFQKNPEDEVSSGGGTHLILQSQRSSGVLIAATAGSVFLILVLLVLCCYFKRQKGPRRCLARPEASKKNQSQRETTRNNEIVYADLQPIGKNPQSKKPAEEKGLHSEYATIHVQ
ncbi:tyrosine-protein phosphatase non-receptor type substrate 1-like isoform X1 [Phascolarctos cinereus]|uniref:Tyrosine-protein phosphatase non-receptor type substrate 1-like isoform X1 n=1 Tax=Phascolarctos cinereus TaxID=38626 RepID=A0A6P5IGQ2_PHACI|nr:tyrosine-protein phosphatase non-receptor type substrate 1-like isoform X1 [Phascolarctos cinereus]